MVGVALVTGCGGRVLVEGDAAPAESGQSSGQAGAHGSGQPGAQGSGQPGAHGSGQNGAGSGGGALLYQDAGDFPLCPSELPRSGSACSMPAQGCAYVSPDGCQAVFCNASGHWQGTAQGC
jgi:hypothetical protein